ncbi:MAG: cytochrome D ubiquinol oxidase subunit I, partial [bacterium]
MKTFGKLRKEETLDPQDWQAMKSLGRQMVDEIFDYLQSVRERPVWQPVPKSIRAQFKQPIPIAPQRPEDIYRDFVDYVLPYPMGNI